MSEEFYLQTAENLGTLLLIYPVTYLIMFRGDARETDYGVFFAGYALAGVAMTFLQYAIIMFFSSDIFSAPYRILIPIIISIIAIRILPAKKSATPKNSINHKELEPIVHTNKNSEKKIFSKFLERISTIKGRLIYSLFPYIVFMALALAINSSGVISTIKKEPYIFPIHFISFYVASFIILTLLSWVMNKLSKYWSTRKDLRLWVFGSGLWVIGVILYTMIMEPYGRMSDDDYLHLFIIMLAPPLFIGFAKYIYEKYIK